MASQPESMSQLVVAVFSDDNGAAQNTLLAFPGAAAVVFLDAKSTTRRDKLMYIDLFGLAQGWALPVVVTQKQTGKTYTNNMGWPSRCGQAISSSCRTRRFRSGAKYFRGAGGSCPAGGPRPFPGPAPPTRRTLSCTRTATPKWPRLVCAPPFSTIFRAPFCSQRRSRSSKRTLVCLFAYLLFPCLLSFQLTTRSCVFENPAWNQSVADYFQVPYRNDW